MHSYDAILDALRAEGLKVVEVPGARARCRCHSGPHKTTGPLARSFSPTGDVMVHITAGDRGARSALQYIADIINGDPNVPMKSQFVTDYDGTVYLNSTGRCNHAGRCGSAAVSKSRAQALPTSGYTAGYRGSDADGNTVWYGIENIAARSMTAAQRESSVRICAAMGRLHRRDGLGTIGHGEASNQRSYADPNLDMGQFRRDVAARIKNSTTNQEDDMPSAADVWTHKFRPYNNDKPGGMPAETAGVRLRRGVYRAGQALILCRSIAGDVAGLKVAVDQLAKSQGVDQKALEAAVSKATKDALKSLDLTFTVEADGDEDEEA